MSEVPREVDLYNLVHWKKQRREELKEKYEREKFSECTFSPRINQISDKIVSFKRGKNAKNSTIHDSLFNEYKDRKDRQKKLE